jgi:hypothetical protein
VLAGEEKASSSFLKKEPKNFSGGVGRVGKVRGGFRNP